MKRQKKFLIHTWCGTILMALPQCANRHRVLKKEVYVSRKKDTSFPDKQTPTSITIWIHGTQILKNSPYIKEFDCTTKLKPASKISKWRHLYKIARALHKGDPQRFAWQTMYIFGWPGTLRAKKRQWAAQKLYTELQRVQKEFESIYKTKPIIRILTHSHGGNVALNMAHLERTDLTIDELILLACPVQQQTQDYIQHPMFKKIYTLYSSLDFIQVIAPQFKYKHKRNNDYSLWREINWIPTSNRRFPEHTHLAQTKIKLNGRALFHDDFVKTQFLSSMSEILDAMDNMKQEDDYEQKAHLLAVNISNEAIA